MQDFAQLPRIGHGLAVQLDEMAQQIACSRTGQSGQRRAVEPTPDDGRRSVKPRQSPLHYGWAP
jgi:hypothetical protein